MYLFRKAMSMLNRNLLEFLALLKLLRKPREKSWRFLTSMKTEMDLGVEDGEEVALVVDVEDLEEDLVAVAEVGVRVGHLVEETVARKQSM